MLPAAGMNLASVSTSFRLLVKPLPQTVGLYLEKKKMMVKREARAEIMQPT